MEPRIFFGNEKFPLLTLPPQLIRLGMRPGGHTVWLYRDDPSDFAYGGNKVRFYEYLLPGILREKPQVILTSGSLYSNHIRVTAELCRRFGWDCRLLVTADRPDDAYLASVNNLTLAQKAGAEPMFAGGFAALLKLEEYKKQLTAQGKTFYHVPNAGHAPGAVRAYAEVLCDALALARQNGFFPERVFLPCASGTTMAGVLTGAEVLRQRGLAVPPVTAYRVGNTQKGALRGVGELWRGAGVYTGLAHGPLEPDIRDCGKNDYGCPDEELLALRQTVLQQEGIALDRTYNINAFYGMVRDLTACPGDSPVLYLCTGGFCG